MSVVSVGGGSHPNWSDDGRELLYLLRPTRGVPDALMRVPLEVAEGDPPSLIVWTPERLFDWRCCSAPGRRRFHDVSSDGQRIITIMNPALSDPGAEGSDLAGFAQLNLVLNWFEALTERVPVN